MDGSAGGVRTAVAVGMGVSLGMGVAVGCRCATAVSKACVSAALMSGVEAGVAWHALKITVSRLRRRKTRVNLYMDVYSVAKAVLKGCDPSQGCDVIRLNRL